MFTDFYYICNYIRKSFFYTGDKINQWTKKPGVKKQRFRLLWKIMVWNAETRRIRLAFGTQNSNILIKQECKCNS